MRPLPVLLAWLLGPTAWATPRPSVGPVTLHVVRADASGSSRVWVEGCGLRAEVPGPTVTLHVHADLHPCTLAVFQDHHAALAWRAVRVRQGSAAERRVRMPGPGATATAGFLLAPAPGGARIVPLDHAPLDPSAAHPATLGDLRVLAVQGHPTARLDAWDLIRLVHGPPGTRLRLRGIDADGRSHTLAWTRQAAVPWGPAGPPAHLVDAWVRGLDAQPYIRPRRRK